MILSPAHTRLVVGLGSSYANIILMALITVLVVPIYVRTLGAQPWGTVALCMTLQGALHALDVAVAPLMLRDIARAARHGGERRVYLRFRRIYAGIALALAVSAQLWSWLRNPGSPGSAPIDADLSSALTIGLVQFVCQFSNNAALGYWNGLERQRLANARAAVFLLAKHALALLGVSLYWPSALAYLLPFAAIGAIEVLANHRRVMRDPEAAVGGTEDLARTNWTDLGVFSVAAAIGVLSMQVDRIYLSLTLPAAQYGAYFLVSNLMLSLLSLQVPIQRTFLPRMATAAEPRQVAKAMALTSCGLLVLPCLVAAPFAEPLLRWWLRENTTAAMAASSLSGMLVATALIALSAASTAQLISQQRYRAIAAINSTALALQVVLLTTLSVHLGMFAGALAWMGFGAVQVIYAGLLWRTSIPRSSPVAGP